MSSFQRSREQPEAGLPDNVEPEVWANRAYSSETVGSAVRTE